jgi:DnaK suppressor protein
MFVSFLQRFGFLAPSAAAEPLKSPAEGSARPSGQGHQADRQPTNKANKRQDGRITPAPVSKAEGHPQANAQRRQDVKAPAKKNKTPAKVAAKPSAQSVAKPATKSVVKPAAKPAAKTATKAVGKQLATQKAVKPVLKATVKVASSVKKMTTKEVSQKSSASKSVIKPVVKPSVKPAVKSAVKLVVKPVSKSPPASSVKAAPTSAAKAASLPTKPAPAPSPAVPSAPKTMITPPPALKPGRRSSARTAAQSPPPAPMVPTHAPDAAKASYSTITERVISPPPHVAARKDPKLANNWKTKEASELTDEEVKAMPDSEYMNDKQLAFFRHKLSILKSEIHASAGQTTENLREDTVVVPDPADRATIEEEHALELRTRDRERKLLKKIEQSISRIDAGDYGYCDETGEAIGVGRLIARPTASLSLEAQQRRELKQKLFGD